MSSHVLLLLACSQPCSKSTLRNWETGRTEIDDVGMVQEPDMIMLDAMDTEV
jgi:hypothetical protein